MLQKLKVKQAIIAGVCVRGHNTGVGQYGARSKVLFNVKVVYRPGAGGEGGTLVWRMEWEELGETECVVGGHWCGGWKGHRWVDLSQY